MLTFFDDDDLSETEKLDIQKLLLQSSKHENSKCFFLDNEDSIEALQHYEKTHGPLPPLGYSTGTPLLTVAPLTTTNIKVSDVHTNATNVIPATPLGAAVPLSAASPFGALGNTAAAAAAAGAYCFPAPGFLAHPPPSAQAGLTAASVAGQWPFVYGCAPAAAGPYFYPLYVQPTAASAVDVAAFQQARSALSAAAVAANDVRFPIGSFHATAPGATFQTLPVASATLAEAASAKMPTAASTVSESCDAAIPPATAVAPRSDAVAEVAAVEVAVRDVVPVDPQPNNDVSVVATVTVPAVAASVVCGAIDHSMRSTTPPVKPDGTTKDASPSKERSPTKCDYKQANLDSSDPDSLMPARGDTTSASETDLSRRLESVDTSPNLDIAAKALITNDLIVSVDVTGVTPVVEPAPAPLANNVDAHTPPTKATAGGNKSWASLFRNTVAANNAIVISRLMDDEAELNRGIERSLADMPSKTSGAESAEIGLTTVDRDPSAQKLGKVLLNYKLEHKGPSFPLRGLKNFGNWCYVNATLQALLACPPFVHLLRSLKFMELRTPSSTPFLDALVKFVGEFSGEKYGRKSDDKFYSFEPSYVYNVLRTLRDDASFTGRQEDAEEFLGLVLNRLHEETAACMAYGGDTNAGLQNGDSNTYQSSGASQGSAQDGDTSEWRTVCPGRKLAILRTSKLAQSPIAEIFSGVLRNSFQQCNSKETVSLESFFTLQLSVQSHDITSLTTALQQMGKEVIFRKDPTRKTDAETTRRTTFQELPIVLILHLKYFVYADWTVKKHTKQINYGMDLQIDRQLVASSYAGPGIQTKLWRSYKLFAVVFHHGEKAEGGHYTADIFHGGQWVNMDDAKFEAVNDSHVLDYAPPRVPYLLFYRRCDVFSDNRALQAQQLPLSQMQHSARN